MDEFLEEQRKILNKLNKNRQSKWKLSKQLENIACSFVEVAGKVMLNQKVLIWFDNNPDSSLFILKVYELCLNKGATVTFFRRDLKEDSKFLKSVNNPKLGKLVHFHDHEKKLVESSDTVLIIRGPINPVATASNQIKEEARRVYEEGYSKAHEARVSKKVHWSLMYWITQFDAKREEMNINEYTKEYIKACNQDWAKIKEQQKTLVGILNSGKTLRFISDISNPNADMRTDIAMKLEEGSERMDFVNSTVGNNYPGSEVYSAPILKSVTGQIFSAGNFIYQGQLMKDIYLKFRNGKILIDSKNPQKASHCDFNNEGFMSILSQGIGTRYLGEVALGTNPGIDRRFINPLLAEKGWGTFHVAIGHCYDFTKDEDGKQVNVNNGNTSGKTPIHWDITTPLTNGAIILDGKIIQINGVFVKTDSKGKVTIDSKLDALSPKEAQDKLEKSLSEEVKDQYLYRKF